MSTNDVTNRLKKQYRYVHSFVDRHGIVRNYFRRNGYARIALPDQIGSPEFVLAHVAALNASRRTVPASALRGGVERGGAQPLVGATPSAAARSAL
jgi:hypothetical protein